jgi:hypothetical protein
MRLRLKKREATEDYRAEVSKVRYQQGYSPKISDLDQFSEELYRGIYF